MTPENAAGRSAQRAGLTPENAELLAESAGHLERSPLTGRSPHLPRLSPLESHRYAVAGQVRAVSAAAALHRHHAERDPAQRGSEATGSASQGPPDLFRMRMLSYYSSANIFET